MRNALLDYSENLRSRILVVAIAPAAYIYQQTCAQVIHYRADKLRDIVPRFDQDGAERSKETIVDLPSHANAPLIDHPFMSPTYQRDLIREIDNYMKKAGGIS